MIRNFWKILKFRIHQKVFETLSRCIVIFFLMKILEPHFYGMKTLLKSIHIIPNTKEIFQYQFNFSIKNIIEISFDFFSPISNYFPIILHLLYIVHRNILIDHIINNQYYKNKNIHYPSSIPNNPTIFNPNHCFPKQSPPIWTQHKDPPILQSLERGEWRVGDFYRDRGRSRADLYRVRASSGPLNRKPVQLHPDLPASDDVDSSHAPPRSSKMPFIIRDGRLVDE